MNMKSAAITATPAITIIAIQKAGPERLWSASSCARTSEFIGIEDSLAKYVVSDSTG
jgi:hypothetical protein